MALSDEMKRERRDIMHTLVCAPAGNEFQFGSRVFNNVTKKHGNIFEQYLKSGDAEGIFAKIESERHALTRDIIDSTDKVLDFKKVNNGKGTPGENVVIKTDLYSRHILAAAVDPAREADRDSRIRWAEAMRKSDSSYGDGLYDEECHPGAHDLVSGHSAEAIAKGIYNQAQQYKQEHIGQFSTDPMQWEFSRAIDRAGSNLAAYCSQQWIENNATEIQPGHGKYVLKRGPEEEWNWGGASSDFDDKNLSDSMREAAGLDYIGNEVGGLAENDYRRVDGGNAHQDYSVDEGESPRISVNDGPTIGSFDLRKQVRNFVKDTSKGFFGGTKENVVNNFNAFTEPRGKKGPEPGDLFYDPFDK